MSHTYASAGTYQVTETVKYTSAGVAETSTMYPEGHRAAEHDSGGRQRGLHVDDDRDQGNGQGRVDRDGRDPVDRGLQLGR